MDSYSPREVLKDLIEGNPPDGRSAEGVFDPESAPSRPGDGVDPTPRGPRSEPRPHTHWAELLRRTFEIDVLHCPGCGGRLLATIAEPQVVRKILSHLGIATQCLQPLPARLPPWATPSFPELSNFHNG